MTELLAKLRHYPGLFCIVGVNGGGAKLPPEFSIHEHLEVPDTIVQLQKWHQIIPRLAATEKAELDGIMAMYPMHLDEIDVTVRQASILSTVRSLDERAMIGEIREVLERSKRSQSMALLFGASK